MRHVDSEEFPRQFARTRRFSLGAPRDFTVSRNGERVLFLRSASGSEPRALLWCHEAGEERLLADPGDSAGVAAYAADAEARLVAYVADGALWTVRTDGGPPRRVLTAGPGPVGDPRPAPDGGALAYLAGGSLRVVRADGTDDRPLADPDTDPGADPSTDPGEVSYGRADRIVTESLGRARGYWWSPDGAALLVARVDTSAMRRRHLADPTHPERPPTSHRYPAAGTPNPAVSLHVFGVAGGHVPVRLPAADPDGGWGPAFEYVIAADWTHAGPVVALQSRDQRTVWVLRIDPATGSAEPLHRITDEDWVEVTPGTPLHTAAGVPVLPGVRGDAHTVRIGDVAAPDGLQVRQVLGAVGERVLFTASEEPTETHVWCYDAGPAGRGFERLTSEPGVHTAVAGGDTLVLDSATPDGQTVTVLRGGRPAGRLAVLAEQPSVPDRGVHLTLGPRDARGRLHLPSWYEPGAARLPVLLCPYSGPGRQIVTRARGWWTVVAQWFAEQGFAVLAVDGRGTPGRGVAWRRGIRGDRLGPVLDDQVDALHDAAERCEALDLTRVGIRGWSYSGYLAAGAVLRRPDVFHAAVAGAPPTDRRLYNTYWEERYLGHPELHPEGYDRSSLLPHAERLSRPLMLVHGLADENVGPVHTFRLSAALLAAGRPHTLLPLPGVGHLVDREGTADTLLRIELDFLQRALSA